MKIEIDYNGAFAVCRIEPMDEQWQDRDHFPDIAEGSVFPVWVRVERINERV